MPAEPHTNQRNEATVSKSPSKSPCSWQLREATLTVEPSRRKKVQKVRILLEGKLTIESVELFIDKMETVSGDYEQIDIFLSNIQGIDLTYTQALHHLKTYLEQMGKSITIDADLSAEHKKLVIQCGFSKLFFRQKLA